MNLAPAPALIILAGKTLEGFTESLFDNTFAGIHQLSWFDYAVLIPYFACVGILSLYGLHRYEILRSYWKARRNWRPAPPGRVEDLPRVTIQLPIYNERYVVERLLEAVSRIEYPRDRLQVQVLDDSTDETHPFTERLVNEYRAAGFPFEYHHRTNRQGYKAGALEAGLRTATGELVAIFDADFVPPADFLMQTVGHFADPQVGMVQTRWTYLNRSYSVLTEVQAMLLDGHFVLEHVARAGRGLYFNFNGTAGILRKRMIEDAGGWEHDTLTEDADLSYRAQLKGWKFIYRPDIECPSELPVETYSFQVQQSRWAKGQTQVARKLLGRIFSSQVPLRNKVEAFLHLTPNVAYPLMVVISALMLPVMIVRFYMGWQQLLMLDVPLMVANFASIIIFYGYAQHERDRSGWKRSLALAPALVAAGVALTLINTRAFLEAIFGVQTSFVRTAKYAITGAAKPASPVQSRYRSKSGLLPYLELAFGSYFLLMVLYSIDSYNFPAVPFLLVFVGGYYWAGLTTLHQEYRDWLAWERRRRVPAGTVR